MGKYWIYTLSLAFLVILVNGAIIETPDSSDNSSQITTNEPKFSPLTHNNNNESFKEIKYQAVIADIPACHEKSPDLNECLKNVIETMVVRLRNGDKDLNIPPLDPFVLNRTRFEYSNGPVSGRIVLKTVKVLGFGETQIKNLSINIQGDKVKFRQQLFVPSLQIVGNYRADVTISNIPLKPKGIYNITLDDVNIQEEGEGLLYEKNNHKFLRLSKLDAEPIIKMLNINATGIFPDPALDEVFINITKEYWRQIYRLMLPRTKRFWAPMLLRVVNEALTTVPFDLFVK